MKVMTGAALVILGLVVGFIVAYVLGAGVSLNLFTGLLLLLAGGLAGFIAEWLVDEAYRRNRELARRLDGQEPAPFASAGPDGQEPAAGGLARLLEQREAEMGRLREQAAAQAGQVEALRAQFEMYQRTHPDNLTVIKGIGPIYQWKLRDAGIHTLRQLAVANPELLRRRLGVKSWQKVDVGAWVSQARDWVEEAERVEQQSA